MANYIQQRNLCQLICYDKASDAATVTAIAVDHSLYDSSKGATMAALMADMISAHENDEILIWPFQDRSPGQFLASGGMIMIPDPLTRSAVPLIWAL